MVVVVGDVDDEAGKVAFGRRALVLDRHSQHVLGHRLAIGSFQRDVSQRSPIGKTR